jgi:pimeloyl-ACP methyl ester carboxylesterase/DNA-binding CsgD family transcriptional regulator
MTWVFSDPSPLPSQLIKTDPSPAALSRYNPNPTAMDKKLRQRVRYLRTEDGVQLAWADIGEGPVVIKAANWLTHLEYDLESPVWGHWIRFLGEHFRFLRWDERGCGLTDRDVDELSFERWLGDLEALADVAGVDGPFALLGISSGAAICAAYAARHPERVSRLILYGGYARGWAQRGDSETERQYRAIAELMRVGWGKENPVFRQVFTSRFVPGASEAQVGWFNDLCRRTSTGEMAARLLEVRSRVDVSDLLGAIQAPTLVIHSRDDEVCPVSEARRLAAGIPAAQFVELDSRNHILLEDEPAWARFQDVVLDFMGLSAPHGEDSAFAHLTAREREVLALITEGLANAVIGERLSISEKTVRNHVSNLFDKLGVWTRAQAIVFARDRDFRP